MLDCNGSLSKPPILNSKNPESEQRRKWLGAIVRRFFRPAILQAGETASLDRGWIIANHKLVSFHAAFLSSLLSISPLVASRFDVIRQMFLSVEVVISSAMWYAAWHCNIAIHEIGHYLAAVKTNNLRPELAAAAEKKLEQGTLGRWLWYLEMFVKIPYGAFPGVNKEAGSFHPAVKTQNLAVAAAGPKASLVLTQITFLPGIILAGLGLYGAVPAAVYAGRLLFAIGVVALFDFLLSDAGKYKAFRARQQEAAAKTAEVRAAEPAHAMQEGRPVKLAELRRKLRLHRLQELELADGRIVFAPWEFRNSIMGGRHTEEMGGNLSFQELMFLPLSAQDYIEAQRVTNLLQSRAIQIIQDTEGLNFVGIGLEGGIVASYAKEKGDLLPEERALRVAVQAIEECGFVPDRDVCLALDPAASELSNAYREKTGEKGSVGQYLFWRAEDPKVLTTDEMVELYIRWVKKYPIVSLEDPFAEDDYEGWKKLMKALDQEILIIGDDLVTTKDSTIRRCAEEGLINTALIKANQIGTLERDFAGDAYGERDGTGFGRLAPLEVSQRGHGSRYQFRGGRARPEVRRRRQHREAGQIRKNCRTDGNGEEGHPAHPHARPRSRHCRHLRPRGTDERGHPDGGRRGHARQRDEILRRHALGNLGRDG